jgi:transcriptional regulator with XRE-family HTH domain
VFKTSDRAARPASTINRQLGLAQFMTPEEQQLSRAIGQRLRAARKGRGKSLQALSEATGGALATSRISNYELGTRRLSLEAAQILAEALGNVSAAYLLCLESPEQPSSPAEVELLAYYRATDDPGRAAILAVAEGQGRHG